TIVDIDLLLGEHLDTLLTEDREIDFNPIRDIEELENLLADNPVPVLRVFDAPLGEVERSDLFFSLTQSGEKTRVMETPSFGFHHMPPPHPAAYSPKEVMYCFYHPHLTSGVRFDHELRRGVERSDPFSSLTQSGEKTRVMGTPSFGFHHMPPPRPAAYSPKEVMYRFYHPHLTSGVRFDHELR
nr:hypothetical protein [Tanacetum cinerariifolium]